MARFIAQSGFSGTIGGTAIIYGTADIQTITVADHPGTITFDASFNRGGNVIALPKAASEYQVLRNGSSVLIIDSDTTVSVPVGTTSNIIQFADGDRLLRYDGAFKLGEQVIDTTPKSITTAGSQKISLADDTSTTMSRLIVSNETIAISGKVSVIGSAGAETVRVLGGKNTISLDASFNRGGDRVILDASPETYSIRMNGSSANITQSGAFITIPIGTKGLDIEFGSETRKLFYAKSAAYLGTQVVSSNDAPIYSYLDNLDFNYVENAFRGTLPFANTASTCFGVIDVNGDGYKDIVFAFWTGQTSDNWGKNVGDIPTPDKLAVFINHAGNYFVDETAAFIDGTDKLGGASRKIEAADVNNDGKLDLLFAVNREDGRSGDPWSNSTAYLSAFVSQGERYKVYNFGVKDWYHSVGFGVLDGKVFVSGAGFTGASSGQGGFTFSSFQFLETQKLDFDLSPNTFTFFSPNGGAETNYLIQTQAHPNLLGIEGWVYTGSQWVSAGKINNPFPFVKNVKMYTYNGDFAGDVPVYKMGETYILGGGGFAITESSLIDVNKDGRRVVIMKMETPIINNFDEYSTSAIYQNKDITSASKFIFATIENEKIKILDIKIFDEKTIGLNFNYLEIIDINKDGYDDIIVGSYSDTGYPTIYTNNRDGSFSLQNLSFDTPFRYHYHSAASSIVADFNNDGVVDVVTFPGNGNDISKGTSMADYRYYVGSNSLTMG